MKYTILILIVLMLFSSACSLSNRGGSATYDQTDVITVDAQGKKTETITTKSSVIQPDDPKSPATLIITPTKNGTEIKANTGNSYNIDEILAGISLLRIPMYAGLGLIVVAVLVGVIFKQIQWAVAIGATGLGMAVGSYLLAKYAIWFLLGFGILAIYGVYLIRDYFIKHKGAEEMVMTVDAAKVAGAIDIEKFNKVANEIQSKTTMGLVNKIQGS